MTFNPNLSSGASYEQPVVATNVNTSGSAVSAISSIINGLGVFDRPEQQSLSRAEEYQIAVGRFQEANPDVGNVTEWSLATNRAFIDQHPSFAPQHTSTLNLTRESRTLTPEEASLNAFNEWAVTSEGMAAQGAARTRFPEDPAAQRNYINAQFAELQVVASNLTNLQRLEQTGESTQNISNQAWDIAKPQMRVSAERATQTLTDIYTRVRSGESVSVAEAVPEIAASDPSLASLVINTPEDLNIIGQRIRGQFGTMFMNELSGVSQVSIIAPTDEYLDSIFQEFDIVLGEVAKGTDPVLMAQRTEARNQELVNAFLRENNLTVAAGLQAMFGDSIKLGLLQEISDPLKAAIAFEDRKSVV